VTDRTPREHLAYAIERRAQLEAEAATLAAAAPAARRAQNEAMVALEAAKESVETATKRAATHAIAALAGTAVAEAPIDAETARVDLRRAQDRVDAANATRAEIDRRQQVVAERLLIAPSIDAAAREVIYAESRQARDALVQRIRAAVIDFNDATASLWVLLRGRPSPPRKEDQEHVAAASAGTQLPDNADLATLAKLRAWQDALMTDATAEMPR
jgi:hypothetical protein